MSVKNSRVYIILFTFAFSFVFVALLSVVNMYTAETIEKNNKLFLQKAVLNAMDIEFPSDDRVFSIFNEKVTPITIGNRRFFTASREGTDVLAVIFKGNGLWGTINGVVAVDGSASQIVGMDIISHSETPGLGGRIEEEWYRRQFRGEDLVNDKITVDLKSTGEGNYDHDDGTIDTITGATRTSEYMEDNINSAVQTIIESRDKLHGRR